MSDFDERLTAVLTAGSDAAPHPAGLTAAARRRHVRRRRRRIAVGAVAAAVAVVAPVAVLAGGGGGGDDVSVTDGTTPPPPGDWQTVGEEHALADVPADWQAFTCSSDGGSGTVVYGPTDREACSFETYLAFYAGALYDAALGPGVISTDQDRASGYVYAGQEVVSASTVDPDLTRQILATARTEGQPPVDASEWIGLEGDGLRADIPANWGLGRDADLESYKVCAAPGDPRHRPQTEQKPGVAAYLSLAYDDGRWISVSAPTQAIADLVAAAADSRPAHSDEIGCAPQVLGG